MAENWVVFWTAGAGKVVTQAKIEEKRTTVMASRMIVATTSETPRPERRPRRARREERRPAERSDDPFELPKRDKDEPPSGV